MNYETKNLKVGTVRIFKKGDEELIAYETKDPIVDQVILLKNKDTLISIEAPLLKNNVEELNDYIESLNVKNKYILLVDHVATESYLKEAKLISSKDFINELKGGTPIALFNKFRGAFGDAIEENLRSDFEAVDSDLEIDGLKLKIISKGGEGDVEIPEFNAIYTHMLGHDCHSIIGGNARADALISEFTSFLDKGYEVVLTSHYTPETKEDVKTKIAYLKNIKEIAVSSSTKEEFLDAVKKVYPNYSGLNYLETSADFFFQA